MLSKKYKILIGDDHPSNLSALKAHLQEYYLIEAANGRYALKKVFEEKPDLIILDTMLPGVDGYSVLAILKNSEDTQNSPVVLLTSSTGTDDKIKSLEKGADDFLPKPFNPLELRARVKSLLRLKDMQDDIKNLYALTNQLALALEANDPYWLNHSKRVAIYAEKLAQRVIPVKSIVQLIKTAAILHDIGKIKVPRNVLEKSGHLEADELSIIQQHPLASENLCSSMTGLQYILPYIRHHHERFDGTGYPDELKGLEIPLGARILAVADGYDALTHDRPHRKAYSPEQAKEILLKNAGIQWDPDLVKAFCEILDSQGALIEQMVCSLEAGQTIANKQTT